MSGIKQSVVSFLQTFSVLFSNHFHRILQKSDHFLSSTSVLKLDQKLVLEIYQVCWKISEPKIEGGKNCHTIQVPPYKHYILQGTLHNVEAHSHQIYKLY